MTRARTPRPTYMVPVVIWPTESPSDLWGDDPGGTAGDGVSVSSEMRRVFGFFVPSFSAHEPLS